MAVSPVVLIQRKQAENSQTAQYTANNCKAIIDKFTATNTSAGNVPLSVNLVPSGGSADNTNLVVKTKVIAPGETYTFPELIGQTLNAGDIISTLAGAATSITISAAGREIT